MFLVAWESPEKWAPRERGEFPGKMAAADLQGGQAHLANLVLMVKMVP